MLLPQSGCADLISGSCEALPLAETASKKRLWFLLRQEDIAARPSSCCAAYIAAECHKRIQRVCLVLVLGCGCFVLEDHIAKLGKIYFTRVVLVHLQQASAHHGCANCLCKPPAVCLQSASTVWTRTIECLVTTHFMHDCKQLL